MHPPVILTNPDLPRLFCKPLNPERFVYYADVALQSNLVSFWSLHIDKHLPQIYQWVNMEYAAAYWQMDGSYEALKEVYETILAHPNAHSFVGYHGDQLICQLDVYMIGVDELSFIIPEASVDCGFHLLMAPNKQPVKGLTKAIIQAFLHYYFSFSQARKMYAEPDVRNEKSIRLLKEAGFQFLRTVELSYKKAYLFCLNRSTFANKTPGSHPEPATASTIETVSL